MSPQRPALSDGEAIADTTRLPPALDAAPPQPEVTHGGGYWYPENPSSCSSVKLLNLLREYREAETAMRARTCEEMGMGETDLVALRFLLRERSAGRVCRQRDLARALNMTPASTSNLVDRLSRDGYIRRAPHPEDRRSVGLEILDETDREVKATLTEMHTRMICETESLTEEERAGAAKFLTGLIRSVCSATDQ
ncbi:MarR family winged helix-turn-helix transcriptional regulator [Nesterenkonia natronophila]|uniref:MarR family transcriptional regulator n=1 Tax=Nesterenkonia natronophila TaxID=2174932 RepID=A0A3A4FBK6_9MICC|nr:MarR family transcriptional regulator [Nesterenkonia natronophila]RJN32497.1 MarR family transcriptional regulator [Nesterenkonia natronophila]